MSRLVVLAALVILMAMALAQGFGLTTPRDYPTCVIACSVTATTGSTPTCVSACGTAEATYAR